MRRPGLFKFNRVIWGFFTVFFYVTCELVLLRSFGFVWPLVSFGVAAAISAAIVCGYDIVAGVVVRRIDRDWREEEIRIQKSALAAERRRQEEGSAALLRRYLSDRRAAE